MAQAMAIARGNLHGYRRGLQSQANWPSDGCSSGDDIHQLVEKDGTILARHAEGVADAGLFVGVPEP